MTDFARRLDALYERRFGRPPMSGGRPRKRQVIPRSGAAWLSELLGCHQQTVTNWRVRPSEWAYAVLRLLEERQDLRERLAAALRENRKQARGLQAASRLLGEQAEEIRRIRARPLYAPRDSELDEIQAEEWRRAGVIA